MQGLLIAIDKVNTWVGKIFSWSIVAMTFVIVYEVVSRYVFSAPTTWAYDVSYMLYGTLFMMAGPYALARNGHVRGDFLYRRWSPRVQAIVDLTLYILFFFAAVLAPFATITAILSLGDQRRAGGRQGQRHHGCLCKAIHELAPWFRNVERTLPMDCKVMGCA